MYLPGRIKVLALNSDKTFSPISSPVSVIWSPIFSDSGYTACLHRMINVFLGLTPCIVLGRPACKSFGIRSSFVLMAECGRSRSLWISCTYQTSRRHIPEDTSIYRHSNENLKCHVICVFTSHIKYYVHLDRRRMIKYVYYWQFLRKSDALCYPTDQRRILNLNKIRHWNDKFHVDNYELLKFKERFEINILHKISS
jgi:hypothetical protein